MKMYKIMSKFVNSLEVTEKHKFTKTKMLGTGILDVNARTDYFFRIE